MILCDLCQVNPATLKLTQIVNDQKTEINICKECDEAKGLTNPLGSIPPVFGTVLFGMLSQQIPDEERTESTVTCEQCGLSKTDFERRGLLGCNSCYETFEDDLKFVLRRIHGSNKHIGKRPPNARSRGKLPGIDVLRKKLKSAVENEHFEEAAKLRDLIRDAESRNRAKSKSEKNDKK